jgi:UDP:flavonoid glycosyltransferase YjiC (YdhE family)
MAQKLITIYTAGTLGDHLPYFALAKTLSQHGHHVRMALNSSMTQYARAANLEYVELPTTEGGEEEARKFASAWDFWSRQSHQPKTIEYDQIQTQKTLDQCRALVNCCKESDLLLSTTIRPQGYICTALTHIPWISISMNPISFAIPQDPEEYKKSLIKQNYEYELLSKDLSTFVKYLGGDLPVPPFSSTWIWAPLILLASSPVFYRPDPAVYNKQTTLIQTGFFYYEDPSWKSWQPDPELLEFCEPINKDDRPMVLAFSSQPLEDPKSILQKHALAAQILNKKLLVQRGWAGFSSDMLPEGVDSSRILFRDFLPQDWVFERASCCIQHGGIGSIARSLRQACPLLIEPFGNDQFFNATRVGEMGVGAVANPFSSTPETIARIVSMILQDKSLHNRLHKVSTILQSENGTETASKIIDRFFLGLSQSDRYWSIPPIYQS